MADLFISFSTADTIRVQPIIDQLRASGLSVFWSNDIPTGSTNYQNIIIEEIRDACLVLVLWTNSSVKSSPVAQECSQATKHHKLFQVLLDDIEPILIPMEADFKSQKTCLVGWSGNSLDQRWARLLAEIIKKVGSASVKTDRDWTSKSTLLGNRRLSDIAEEIEADWGSKIDPTVRDYLEIMGNFNSVTETRKIVGYPFPLSGEWVVSQFLANCGRWKGPVAQRIKKELRALHTLCEIAQIFP